MRIKRIIPCLDVKKGRLVKGMNFQGLSDVSDPVELARYYSESGADELLFHEIAAPGEDHGLFTEMLRAVASRNTIPLTAGGGIETMEDVHRMLGNGAGKVSINAGVSGAQALLEETARSYGSGCVVLAADLKRVRGEYHIFRRECREDTGLEAIAWIRDCVARGAGEVVVNSIDMDGVKKGFDLPMLKRVCDAIRVPVIASGGAGSCRDFTELFRTIPEVDAALAASVFHFGEVNLETLKRTLANQGVPVRR